MIFVWHLLTWVVVAIIHIAFALGVLKNATDRDKIINSRHKGTFLVSGGIWALATLIGGIFVVGIYWLIHCSTLRPQQDPEAK